MRTLACVLLAAAAAALAIVTVDTGYVFLTAAPVAALVTVLVRVVRIDPDDPEGRLDLPGWTSHHARLTAKAMISAAVATATGGGLLFAAGAPLGSPATSAGVVVLGGVVGVWATSLIRRALVDPGGTHAALIATGAPTSNDTTNATNATFSTGSPIVNGAPFPDGRATAAVMASASRGERVASVVFAALAVLVRCGLSGPLLFFSTRVPAAGGPSGTGLAGPFGPLAPTAVGAGFFAGPRIACAVAVGAVFSAIPWVVDVKEYEQAAKGSWVSILSVPYRVGSGVLFAAFAVALVRSARRARIGLRGGADPFRVRFEIGGLGTRVEDMTPARDRGMDTTRLWGLGLFAAVAFFCIAPGVSGLTERLGSSLVLIFGGVAIATMIGRMVGAVGAASGVALITAWLAVTALLDDTSRLAAWYLPSAAALLVSGFVAAELGQDHRAAASFGEAPWRIEGFALVGVLLGGFTLWIGLSWFSPQLPVALPSLVGPFFAPPPLAGFLPTTEAAWCLGALIGLYTELRWRAGVAIGLGAIVPVTWSAPFLLGGFVRWVTNPGHHARLFEHAALGLMIGDSLAILGMVWLG